MTIAEYIERIKIEYSQSVGDKIANYTTLMHNVDMIIPIPLEGLFIFKDTKEGDAFWRKVSTELRELGI